MRILSKFQDYYDCILAQGQDDAVVFVRERKLVPVSAPSSGWPWEAAYRDAEVGPSRLCVKDQANLKRPELREGTLVQPWHRTYVEAFLILAGRAYPVWVEEGEGAKLWVEALVHDRERPAHRPLAAPTPAVLEQRLRSALEAWRERPAGRLMQAPEVKSRRLEFGPSYLQNRERAGRRRAYEAAREQFLAQDFTALHLATGAPVLLVGPPQAFAVSRYGAQTSVDAQWHMQVKQVLAATPSGTTVALANPRLASLSWASAHDPASCFQTIAQFIGGVVPGRQMPMVEISDQSKVAKHGFDPRYGFRKRPADA